MSTHYQIDPFTTNGDIIDVVTAVSGTTESTGSVIIRIPDGVGIHSNPATLSALLLAKYDGLLAFYAGFTQILGDDCQDTLTVDLPLSSRLLVSTGFVNHCLLAGGNYFSSTFLGALVPAPTQCVLTWESYRFIDDDTKSERFTRNYDETSDLTCLVSFNGGATYSATTDGAVLNIPVPDQGQDLKVRFTNPAGYRVYLGSWALIY
jgi:hypothetical protein